MDKLPLGFGSSFAVYTRVSTAGQEEGSSIEQQLRECKAYGEKQGWMFIEHLHDTKTGKAYKERKDIKNLLRLIENKRVKNVVFYKVDRTARELSVFKSLVHDIYNLGGTVSISTKERTYNTAAECYRDNFLDAVFAEWEHETIKLRMRGGLKEQFDRGSVIKPLLLGYDSVNKVENGRRIKVAAINPEQSEVVKFIFDTFIQTKSMKSALMETNSRGYRSRRGNAFTFKTIKDILEFADSYAGVPEKQYFDVAKTVSRDFTYPALITREEAEKVKRLLQDGLKVRVDKRAKPFDRLITCRHCGRTAQTYKHAATKGHHVAYDGGFRIQCASFVNAIQENYRGKGIANWDNVEVPCRHQFKEGIFVRALEAFLETVDSMDINNEYYKQVANLIAVYSEEIDNLEFVISLVKEIEDKRSAFNANMAKLMVLDGIDIAAFAKNAAEQLNQWDSELANIADRKEEIENKIADTKSNLRYFGINNPDEVSKQVSNILSGISEEELDNTSYFSIAIPEVVGNTATRTRHQLKQLQAILPDRDWGEINGLMGQLGLRFTADFSERNLEDRRKGVKVQIDYRDGVGMGDESQQEEAGMLGTSF